MHSLKTTLEFAHQPYLLENKLFYVASRGKVRPLFQGLGVLDEAWQRGNTLNWQLWCADFDKKSLMLSNETHIKTGFYVVCSPVVYRESDNPNRIPSDRVMVSFIGGRVTNVLEYALYIGELDEKTGRLQNVQKASDRVSFYGFTTPEYTVQGTRRNRGQFTVTTKTNAFVVSTDLDVAYRIVPLAQDRTQILATGMLEGQETTRLYQLDIATQELQCLGELRVGRDRVYKSIIDDDLCIYAVKQDGDDFEKRYLYASRDYKFV